LEKSSGKTAGQNDNANRLEQGVFNLWNVNLEKSSGKTAGWNDSANRLEQGYLTYRT